MIFNVFYTVSDLIKHLRKFQWSQVDKLFYQKMYNEIV